MIFASLLPSASADKATVEVAVIGLTGGVLGYFLKYYLDRKQAFSSDNSVIKRKMYESYLDGLRKTTKKLIDSSNAPQREVDSINREFGQLADDFYNTSILYGSPRVIRKYADFVRQTDRPQTEPYQYELMIKVSRLYKAMRKDIGLGNWWLGKDGELLLRGNLKDYDATVGEYTRWQNRIARWFKHKQSSRENRK